MEEIIGSASSSQLLFLMSIPAIAAVGLAAFIIYSLVKRNKKSEMKLGIQSDASDQTAFHKAHRSRADASLSSRLHSTLDTPSRSSSAALGDDLNLGILPKSSDEAFGPADSPEDEPIDLAARLGTEPAEETAAPTPTSVPVELLRLLSDPMSDRVLVEVAGQRYAKLSEVPDKETGQYILKLAAHLLAFTNGVIVTDTGMKSISVPKVKSLPEPLGTPSLRPSLAQPVATPESEAALLASLRAGTLDEIAIRQRSGFFGLGRFQPSEPVTPGLNLADEINEIVQSKLSYSSIDKATAITISSDLSGGIRIKVNNTIYSSPEEIPDKSVKELIKSSIREWERR